MFEVTDEIRAVARVELAQRPVSAALRRLAERFCLQRTELACVAAEVFDNMLVPEVQAIWNWDLARDGCGHTDADLDETLSHLVVGTGGGARRWSAQHLAVQKTAGGRRSGE